MRQARHQHFVETKGQGLYEATRETADWVASQAIETGLLTVFIAHTSASITIQENADPDVQADLQDFFMRVAPEGDLYRHRAEGPDDMPAHIKSALTATQVSIPVTNNRLDLGTWQGLFVFEHRRAPQRRRLLLHLIGE